MATITSPSIKRDNYNGKKFFAFIAFAMLAAYAGYQGWVQLPSMENIGGLLGLLTVLGGIGLVVYAANTDSQAWRTIALIGAFVLGIVCSGSWKGMVEFFSSLSLQEWGGFAFATFLTLAMAAWLSHKK